MTLAQITENINKRLAGEMFMYSEVRAYLDAAIDDINARLNTCFPVFSELPVGSTEYTHIPDKYIRTVVVPGAVVKFYTMDDEGAMGSPMYEQEYAQNLFYMERDYLMYVPDIYVSDIGQGILSFSEGHPLAEGGLSFNGGVFNL